MKKKEYPFARLLDLICDIKDKDEREQIENALVEIANHGQTSVTFSVELNNKIDQYLNHNH